MKQFWMLAAGLIATAACGSSQQAVPEPATPAADEQDDIEPDAIALANGTDDSAYFAVLYHGTGRTSDFPFGHTDVQERALRVLTAAVQRINARPPSGDERAACAVRLGEWARKYGAHAGESSLWVQNSVERIARVLEASEPLSSKDIETAHQWLWKKKGSESLEEPYLDTQQQTLCRGIYVLSLAQWHADRMAGKADPEEGRVANQDATAKAALDRCVKGWNERECNEGQMTGKLRDDCRSACLTVVRGAFQEEEERAAKRCIDEHVSSSGKSGTACTLNMPVSTSLSPADQDEARKRCSAKCEDEGPQALNVAKLGPKFEREAANLQRKYRLCMVDAWHAVPQKYKSDRGLRVERMEKETQRCRKLAQCDDLESVTREACESDLAWTTDSRY